MELNVEVAERREYISQDRVFRDCDEEYINNEWLLMDTIDPGYRRILSDSEINVILKNGKRLFGGL